MSGDVRLANEYGIQLVGNRPEWKTIPVRTDGAGDTANAWNSTVNDTPDNANDGVSILTDSRPAPKTIIDVALRDDAARFSSYVRVRTLDPTATYTVTIDGLDHDYDASTGDGLLQTVLEGIRDVINAGVDLGTLTLTFADATPDTIVRGAGDWATDGLTAGAQITLTEDTVGLNDGLTYTASITPVTVTFSCLATDNVVVEAAVDYQVQARRQVAATVIDADDDGVDDTVVIRTLLGKNQTHLPTFGGSLTESQQNAALQLLARDTTEHVTAVAADGTGELEFDQDATTCDVEVFGYDAGVSNPAKPARWRLLNGGELSSLDYRGRAERYTTAGLSRVDVAVRSADGIVRVTAGPGLPE